MFVTEKEASIKVCQETLGNQNPSKCLGSGCMAWRWGMWKEQSEEKVLTGSKVYVTSNKALADKTKPTHGYCGIIGKQEKED